jgi:glycosyltransferase involved in cell wall biosynthesis
MKILQVSSARNFGGGEKHLADLVEGLTARGHEVFLAAPARSLLRERANLPAENFLPLNIGNSLDLFAARQISALIRKHEFEIVHAHPARDYFPASLAARLAPQAKLVLTRHVLFPMKGLHRLALSNVARVIAVSGAVEKQLREQGNFPPEKIVLIPNGIDAGHWSGAPHEKLREEFRAAHGIPGGAFLVGTVGELKKLKGQEDLILAAEIILQQFPEAHFVITGKDNTAGGEYRRYLQNLAGAAGAADRVLWLDWVEDTAPLLHALDVFVSASHSESFGLAMLEAMASGCAVVATETEGAKELLGKKNLAPVEDPLKLAQAVCEILSDGDKRAALGKELQARAGNDFDLQKMIDATEKLYLEL